MSAASSMGVDFLSGRAFATADVALMQSWLSVSFSSTWKYLAMWTEVFWKRIVRLAQDVNYSFLSFWYNRENC